MGKKVGGYFDILSVLYLVSVTARNCGAPSCSTFIYGVCCHMLWLLFHTTSSSLTFQGFIALAGILCFCHCGSPVVLGMPVQCDSSEAVCHFYWHWQHWNCFRVQQESQTHNGCIVGSTSFDALATLGGVALLSNTWHQ